MIIKSQKTIPSYEITDPEVFKNRRKLIQSLLAIPLMGSKIPPVFGKGVDQEMTDPLSSPQSINLTPTSFKLVQNYTNYYEFSFNKEDTTQLAQRMPINPWSVEITGEVENGGVFHLEDILRKHDQREYIHRFRCVEAWSMVIPWIGFPLSDLIKQSRPLSSARFVKFTSTQLPDVMPNVGKNLMLDWPYTEGLRLDEAMHPLALLAIGMYGERLPKQNGSPLRLVVPWKYGFKSIKAIVKIELSKHPPITSWNHFAPKEYGFYANVNPSVPHPRWSQYSERLIGSRFFTPRRKTELFNGYGEQVAHLYANMNLTHFI